MASINFINSNLNYSLETPRRQLFSFPFYLIAYLLDACKSPEVLQKLQKSCKHFLSKKNIIVVDYRVKWNPKKSFYYTNHRYDTKEIIFKKTFKLWFSNYLQIDGHAPLDYIYRCDLRVLSVLKGDWTYKEIELLLNGGRIQDLTLDHLNIKYDDGTPVTLDHIVTKCPKIRKLVYSNLCETFSSNTYEKLNLLKFNQKFDSLKIVMYEFEGLMEPTILCQFLQRNVPPQTWARILFGYNYPPDNLDKLRSTVNCTLSDLKNIRLNRV